MAKVDEPVFEDMITTQDLTRGQAAQVNKNQKNASEVNAPKNYGKKKITKVMKDASSCKSSKKRKK